MSTGPARGRRRQIPQLRSALPGTASNQRNAQQLCRGPLFRAGTLGGRAPPFGRDLSDLPPTAAARSRQGQGRAGALSNEGVERASHHQDPGARPDGGHCAGKDCEPSSTFIVVHFAPPARAKERRAAGRPRGLEACPPCAFAPGSPQTCRAELWPPSASSRCASQTSGYGHRHLGRSRLACARTSAYDPCCSLC
jgi:hypothetical protein